MGNSSFPNSPPRLTLNLTLPREEGGLSVAASNQGWIWTRLSQSEGAKCSRLREKSEAALGKNKGYGAPIGTNVVKSWLYLTYVVRK